VLFLRIIQTQYHSTMPSGAASKPSPRRLPAGYGNLALQDLQRIPGIGPSLAQDFIDLGIRSVAGLRGRDPQKLYDKLCRITGEQQDRCVLYTFRCAVYFASEAQPDPELLKWWNWKDTKLKAVA
jgi:hypothetical protein